MGFGEAKSHEDKAFIFVQHIQRQMTAELRSPETIELHNIAAELWKAGTQHCGPVISLLGL